MSLLFEFAVDANQLADSSFRIAFGSCNRQDQPQPLWNQIQKSSPDLWLWLGDIVYADKEEHVGLFGLNTIYSEPSIEELRKAYSLQKSNVEYRKMIDSLPGGKESVLGIWDDHDYGLNDAGKNLKIREASQNELLDFLNEPASSPRRFRKGVYESYEFGQEGRKVKVILLDTRYFRDDFQPEPEHDADILGAEQWRWFESQLANSSAQIHIIASGIQIIPDDKDPAVNFYSGGTHRIETWGRFPNSRKRLFELLGRYETQGAIFLSGDIHYAELSLMKCSKVGYPVYELTSSGMTHSWGNSYSEVHSSWPIPKFIWRWYFDNIIQEWFIGRRFRVPGKVFTLFNFGLIDIDWSKNIMTLQIRGEDPRQGFAYRINMADLSRNIDFRTRCNEAQAMLDSALAASFSTHTMRLKLFLLIVVSSFISCNVLFAGILFLCKLPRLNKK